MASKNQATVYPKDKQFKWVHGSHAQSDPSTTVKESWLDPDPQPSSTYFQANDNVMTIDISKDLDEIVDMHVEIPLTNSDASNALTFGLPPQFMFSKWEIISGSEVIKTYKPLYAYLDDNLYYSSHEKEHLEYESRVDKTTRGVFSIQNSIAASASTTVYARVPNFFTQALISPKQLRKQYSLRLYSANDYMASDSAAVATDITNGTIRLRVRTRVGKANNLAIQSRSDYRILETYATDLSESLTSGTEKSIVTKHFNSDDLVSHFMVVIRSSAAANENKIVFLPLTSLAIEDESGNNVTGGQTHTSAQLLQSIFPAHFRNNMSVQPNKAVYVPIVASLDVISDARKGTCTGATKLPANMRLRIVAPASATREVHLIAKKYTHVSVQGGDLKFM